MKKRVFISILIIVVSALALFSCNEDSTLKYEKNNFAIANSAAVISSNVASVNGIEYASIDEAVENAADGSVITLLSEASTPSLVVGNNITLDINGNTLNVGGFLITGSLTVQDSGESKGLIAINRENGTENIFCSTDKALVYNTERNGYEIANVVKQEIFKTYIDKQNNTGEFELIFRPSLDNSYEYNKKMLTGTYTDGNGNVKLNAGLKLVIKLYDATDPKSEKPICNARGNTNGWEYSAALINEVYSQDKAFKFTATFSAKYEKIRYEYMFVSDVGTCCVVGSEVYDLETATVLSHITYKNARGVANTNPATYKYDGKVVLQPLTDEALEAQGITFVGWYNKDNQLVTEISGDVNTDYTLYAKWSDAYINAKYEDYLALNGEDKLKFYYFFDNPADFYSWKKIAKAQYEEEQDREIIGGDKPVEIG